MAKPVQKPLLFLSYDVETDGLVPGLCSMLSLGMAGFTEDKKIVFEYEVNLLPLLGAKPFEDTMRWWGQPEQAGAWNYINTNRQDPAKAMRELHTRLVDLKQKYRVCPVAWPSNFDWQWVNYYLWKFAGDNPLGHTSRCAATYAWCLSKNRGHNDRIDMNQWVDPQYPHTHKALDDAKEQGAMFMNMWTQNTGPTKPLNPSHAPATITVTNFDSLGC